MKSIDTINYLPNLQEILPTKLKKILNTYEAEMATIYLTEPSRMQIFSWTVLPGDRLKNIRIPINNKSIAGYSAQSRKIINIQNVYDNSELSSIDPALSFDPSWDRRTGTRTRQVLVAPILFKQSLIGLVQLINKRKGETFTNKDQTYLSDLSKSLGVAFHNLHTFTRRIPLEFGLLIKNKMITIQDLVSAQNTAQRQQKDVGTVLLNEFRVPKSDLGNALAQFYKTPFEDLSASNHNPNNFLKGKNIDYFRQAYCIPLGKKKSTIILAIDNPNDQVKVQKIKQVLRTDDVELRVALKEDIENYITLIKPAVKQKRNKVRIG